MYGYTGKDVAVDVSKNPGDVERNKVESGSSVEAANRQLHNLFQGMRQKFKRNAWRLLEEILARGKTSNQEVSFVDLVVRNCLADSGTVIRFLEVTILRGSSVPVKALIPHADEDRVCVQNKSGNATCVEYGARFSVSQSILQQRSSLTPRADVCNLLHRKFKPERYVDGRQQLSVFFSEFIDLRHQEMVIEADTHIKQRLLLNQYNRINSTEVPKPL